MKTDLIAINMSELVDREFTVGIILRRLNELQANAMK
jgi:hypothetical protein